jgi:hypothetical protein
MEIYQPIRKSLRKPRIVWEVNLGQLNGSYFTHAEQCLGNDSTFDNRGSVVL